MESTIETSQPAVLAEGHYALPYIPEFLLADVRLYLVPDRQSPREVYLELSGPTIANIEGYYSRSGWNFAHAAERQGEGPFLVAPEGIRLEILEPGKIFAPKPVFRLRKDSPPIPIASLVKRRPPNPWKPTYIQAVTFIKRYEWPHDLSRAARWAIWEIEECGQVPGSVAWQNAEALLRASDSKELRLTLADVFYNRPEDFPLGSQVFLRVLASFGPEGFQELLELAGHPIARKRRVVAETLGDLRDHRAVATLLTLLEDEDPEVRTAALRSIGRVGLRPGDDPEGRVQAYLQSPEVPRRVWAAQAFLKGGDESQAKYLVNLVKEEPRLLTDMGELGDVLAELKLFDAVPYCIQRLKHPKSEYRADAAEALALLTGLDLEYQSMDTEEQKMRAIKAYTRWWEDFKKERRLGVAGTEGS